MTNSKILVFEYISGGGMCAEPLPASLMREGDLMLRALLRDLADIPAICVQAFRDARLDIPADFIDTVAWEFLHAEDSLEERFRESIEAADLVWPIAPETGGILEHLCRLVESLGKPLLNSPSTAVRLAAGKLGTIRRLQAFGIPAVPTEPFEPAMRPAWPVVVKPDDGVGGEGAQIIETPEQWSYVVHDKADRNRVVQPWVEGEALSLSALFAHGAARLLACNRQHIVRKGNGLALEGCGVNAVRDDAGVFLDLTGRIANAVPELWGYAGVDLVLTPNGPLVLEINPRLTTSYAGLRESTGLNPAAAVLETWRLGRLPEWDALPAKPVEIVLNRNHAH